MVGGFTKCRGCLWVVADGLEIVRPPFKGAAIRLMMRFPLRDVAPEPLPGDVGTSLEYGFVAHRPARQTYPRPLVRMSSIPRRISAFSILVMLAVLCIFSHAQAQGAPDVGSDGSNVEGSADSPATVLQDSAPVTPVAPVPAASGTSWSGAPGRGLSVDAGDAFGFNIRARAMIRADFRSPAPAVDTQREWTQAVSVGTLRLWLGGYVYSRNLTWLMQFAFAEADYRDGVTSPVYDAYLNWQLSRDFGVRVGQYFVPFDRLRTIREWGLQMTARPRPVNELTLDRDVGVMFYSDSFLGDESPVVWRLGVFGGRGIHDTSPVEPGALLVARVELRPLGEIDDDMEGDPGRRVQPALALGAGYAINLNIDRVSKHDGQFFRERYDRLSAPGG